ncbi:uncharacterized protein BX663DRAFT_521759 [Cokeromyces recurvatus]|uniref:uncharacterized protein n=1 Tax=Cokeromyces recurvatus TaxID=90255 RepID=UPI00221E9331|nr:uncharacterized protein BX663DRAFT_521759 [Cokeromyces recurvatus]KAI7899196.1 hypothetical protein BX663DRAFT_521759 [Cokeromyces recurvatus]
MSAVLQVKWNGKYFPLEFETTKQLEQTQVKELKSYCQRITGIHPSNMAIYAFGALMNNDDLSLNVYGIRNGCYVILKTRKGPHPHPQRNHSKEKNLQTKTQHHGPNDASNKETISKDEAVLLEQLDNIKNKITNDITPQVRTFEKDVKEFMSQSKKTDKEKKKQIYTGAYLGEQLMHVLFDLDGFVCGPDNLQARQSRKEAVKSAQMLLDKIDEIKSVVKNVAVVDDEV